MQKYIFIFLLCGVAATSSKEQLYAMENEFRIRLEYDKLNDKFIIDKFDSNIFSPHDLEKFKELFKKFQWETIELSNTLINIIARLVFYIPLMKN
ncbi:MAG: hypothetical protein LBH25_14290 [Fibromonadaceae bacterium]|nr:hypothetical protein [Fibromonadaceae bacterium]